MTKEGPAIFHKLRSCGSHLTIQEIGKLDVKVNVIPNGLEKYMAFTVNSNLVFIDSMKFMEFSLDVLVKNLRGNDFKYLPQEFSGDLLELVKQKGVYPYEYTGSFKRFSEDKWSYRCEYFSSLKDECTIETDYSHATNVWNMFKMGAYHEHNGWLSWSLFKNRRFVIGWCFRKVY